MMIALKIVLLAAVLFMSAVSACVFITSVFARCDDQAEGYRTARRWGLAAVVAWVAWLIFAIGW